MHAFSIFCRLRFPFSEAAGGFTAGLALLQLRETKQRKRDKEAFCFLILPQMFKLQEAAGVETIFT